ncbi:transmembrane protein [Ceratobasidium sp. AG-Ba]|nr:transmembrane protein [Ceratobasidium sp. AG-Ba]QRW13621.1 transmembrane protein [Ceratobasidium sp. AG-Ba]
MANSAWQTDILTFCSHARVDPVLSEARITHIQARKSRRPPFLHEYLLVFFTTARGQRFVLRIDRLGKVGSNLASGWPFGTQHGLAANTALQEVGLYHIEDMQSGIDSSDGLWLEMDGRWGSHPVATLATWDHAGPHVSHHLQTATGGPCPTLRDVSRLLEAILFQMPTYHLTTTNCYFMTRSSLLLLQQCYPSAFACYLGDMTGELVPASELAEPIWAGVVRWYWFFIALFFMVYIPLVVGLHSFLAGGCALGTCWHRSISAHLDALKLAVHGLVDVPLPVGIMHAYMSSIESVMNGLVGRLSAEFLGLRESQSEDAEPLSEPFGLFCNGGWGTLAGWCALGCAFMFVIFASLLGGQYGLLTLFVIILCIGVWFNLKFGDSSAGIHEGVEAIFEQPTAPGSPQV